jgi:peptidyl-prolyl cis-trans isomerase C
VQKRTRLASLVSVALVTLTVHAASRPSRAEPDASGPDPDRERRAHTVLTVGARKVTVGELEDHLAAIPPYQLAAFGGSREAIARAYLDQVLTRDLLLSTGAEQRGLDKQLPTSQLLVRALSSATLRKTRGPYPSAAAVPAEEVRRYYDENRSRFDSPERINLWRILCKTREEAITVLETARREGTIGRYNELAREHSIDKATNLRGGNLGFVGPDGASNEAGVKVDPELVKAALTVKDGEFVPQPVTEGTAFAIVWRRGTVPANRRTLEESTAQIRAAIFRERTEAAEKALISDLRTKQVKEVNVGLLGLIELRALDAGLSLARSPASASAPASPPRPAHDAAPR